MTKSCKKCLIEKPLELFHKAPTNRDGRSGHCKECERIYQTNRYRTDPEFRKTVLDNTRKRWETRKYSKSYRDMRRAYKQRQALLHPEKTTARRKVEYAVRKGVLVRGICRDCGTDKGIQAHHEDYLKPLDVIWLCFECHRKHHGNFIEVEKLSK